MARTYEKPQPQAVRRDDIKSCKERNILKYGDLKSCWSFQIAVRSASKPVYKNPS